jgi:hypothetical protein
MIGERHAAHIWMSHFLIEGVCQKKALRLKKAVAWSGWSAYKAPPDANSADAVRTERGERGGSGGVPDKPANAARSSSEGSSAASVLIVAGFLTSAYRVVRRDAQAAV